jgi:signal transduction histidine kinase
MLLVSRVKSGLEQFVFYPIRIDDLLLTTSTRMQSKAREKKITIRFNIDEDLSENDLIIKGEKQLLDSLFENILDNAIKYSPDETTIQLAIKKAGKDLEVWFQDEGPGVPGDMDQNLLGTRFQRGSTQFIPGTGIGLAIAKKIASFHQAEIIYKDAFPKGSLFIVKFLRRKIEHSFS